MSLHAKIKSEPEFANVLSVWVVTQIQIATSCYSLLKSSQFSTVHILRLSGKNQLNLKFAQTVLYIE